MGGVGGGQTLGIVDLSSIVMKFGMKVPCIASELSTVCASNFIPLPFQDGGSLFENVVYGSLKLPIAPQSTRRVLSISNA